ncbi:MAG: rRNA pseudouridine synthase [Sporocytophaga sp.]|nr:rRNA pseudouridine synthase [Sporocytophaga sp.]
MKKDQPQRKGRGASERDKASKFSSKKSSTPKKDGASGEGRPARKSSFGAKKTPAGRVPAGKPRRKFESQGDSGKSERSTDFKSRNSSDGRKSNSFSGKGKGRDFKTDSSSRDFEGPKNKFVRKKFGEDPKSKPSDNSGRERDQKRGRKSDSSFDSRKRSPSDEKSFRGKPSRGRNEDTRSGKSFSKPKQDWKRGSDNQEERPGKRTGFKKSEDSESKRPFSKSNPDKRKSYGGGNDKPFNKPGAKKSFEKPSFKKSFSKSKEEEFESFEDFDDSGNPSEKDTIRSKGSFKKSEEKKPGTRNKTSTDELRLNRYISNAGVCSRREADVLISDGLIKVNGKVVTEMGYKVKRGDTVKYGSKILSPEKLVYVLINKPKDFITTTEDENERKTVMDLVKNVGPERIYPVGRLDRNTTGLLLFTNDGELAEKLMHPSNRTKKLYQAELNKPMSHEDFARLKNGITLEDGPIKPDQLEFVTPDGWVIGIQVHEGRNRLVRRMFEHLGYEVSRLDRVMYAGLTKRDLPRGHWRHLTEKEVIKLKHLGH